MAVPKCPSWRELTVLSFLLSEKGFVQISFSISEYGPNQFIFINIINIVKGKCYLPGTGFNLRFI